MSKRICPECKLSRYVRPAQHLNYCEKCDLHFERDSVCLGNTEWVRDESLTCITVTIPTAGSAYFEPDAFDIEFYLNDKELLKLYTWIDGLDLRINFD